MQTFEIVGRSSKTGRKQKRFVRVNSEQEARVSAEAGDLSILSITLVPEPAATDRQIAYAKDLGIQVPANATLQQMSDLISARLDHDKPADPRYLQLARANGVDCTPYIGKKALFDQIMRVLSKPGRESDLVAWFAFRLSRELFHGRHDSPIDGPDNPIIRQIAAQL